jgi:hypothetical protein
LNAPKVKRWWGPPQGPAAAAEGHQTLEDQNGNVVERFFNRMKNWRPGRRYDMHAVVYRGGVVRAAILDWLT